MKSSPISVDLSFGRCPRKGWEVDSVTARGCGERSHGAKKRNGYLIIPFTSWPGAEGTPRGYPGYLKKGGPYTRKGGYLVGGGLGFMVCCNNGTGYNLRP